MDHASKRSDGAGPALDPLQPGVPIEIQIGQEVIAVWIDETGIHFRQDGATHRGTLPWGVAIAMSLIPPHLPRMASVTAA